MVSPVASSGGRKKSRCILMVVREVATYRRIFSPRVPSYPSHNEHSTLFSCSRVGAHGIHYMLDFPSRLWPIKVAYTVRSWWCGVDEGIIYSWLIVNIRLTNSTRPGDRRVSGRGQMTGTAVGDYCGHSHLVVLV